MLFWLTLLVRVPLSFYTLLYPEVIHVGGRTDASVSVCLSTFMHVPKYGVSVGELKVQNAEIQFIHLIQLLLKFSIFPRCAISLTWSKKCQ